MERIYGKMWAYAGVSVVNAIPCWLGSTMAIDIKVKANFVKDNNNETSLIKTIKMFFENNYGIHDLVISIISPIPMQSGLKSSSAVAVAVIEAIKHKYGLNLSTPELAAKLCKEAGVSITGAFDDAVACYSGGISFTDNRRMKVFSVCELKDEFSIVLLMRGGRSFIDVSKLKNYAHLFEKIFSLAWRGDIIQAMKLNGISVAKILGYETSIIRKALELGALAAGISGNGPSIFALLKQGDEGPVYELFSKHGSALITSPARVSRPLI